MKYGSSVFTSVSALAVTLAVAMPQAAQAQQQAASAPEQEGGLADIVVTAQRRSENLQKVPIAITAVDAGRLQAAGVNNAFALTSAAPGVTIKNQSQTFAPFIRGVGTSAFGPGIENPVALYVDNVYYASQFAAPTDLNDVQQISILKGPQGTLFGRNATGGVIQMTTRDPEFNFGGELRTEIDQYLTSRNFGYVTTPLTDDVAVNLSAHYTTQGDGWGHNLATGKEIFKIDHDWGVRSKLLFKPGDDTTIKIAGDYSSARNNLGPNLVSSPGYVGVFGPVFTGSNRFNVNNATENLNDMWNWGVSGTVEQGLGDLRLVSITAYRKFNFQTAFSASSGPFPGFDIAFGSSGHQFSQEVQLLSDDTGPFKWMAGAYYFNGREQLDYFRNNFRGFYPFVNGGFSGHRIFGSERTKSLASFGQATLEVAPGLNLTGGLRYTHDDRSVAGSRIEGIQFGTGNVIAFGPPRNQTQKINRLTWRASIDYQATPDVLLYASYNRGFKSGGFNLFDPSNPPYQPEQLNAYEAGFKGQFLDRRLRLNASGFYYDYKQIQLTRIQTTAQIVNADKAEFYGIDVDAEAALTDSLSLNASFEWLHAEIKSFPNATTITDTIPFRAIPFDASGSRIPFAARFTLNVGATYKFDVAGANFALNVNNVHNSGYFFEPDNVLRQKPFDLLNASLTWTSPNEKVEVTAFARNILDKAVFAQQSSTGNGRQADFGGNPPFTFGASAKVKFGN